MNRRERLRRAGALRQEAELIILARRSDAAQWRSMWRSRERWMRRWDEEVEAWFMDLHDRLPLEEIVRYTAAQYEIPFAYKLRKQAPKPPDPRTILERIKLHMDQSGWSQEAMAAYISLAMNTSESAGQFSLDALGLNKTFRWASRRDMARDLFMTRGSKVIEASYTNHLSKLAQIILDATDPASPRAIGDVVKDIMEQFDGLARWQAERIARTETAAIWEATHYNTMAANGVTEFETITATGPAIGVTTAAVDQLCLEKAAGGPYTMDEHENLPPYHPNCRCTAIPVLNEWLPPDSPWGGDDLADWVDDVLELN